MNNEEKILQILSQLQNQVMALDSKVGDNHKEIEILNTKVDNINNKVDNNYKEIVALNINVDNNHKEAMTKLDDLENKFDDLESKNAIRHTEMLNKIDNVSKEITLVEAISGKNLADIAHLKLVK